MKLLKKTIYGIFLFFAALLCQPLNIVIAEETDSPNVYAQGAVLMDKKTGRILWEKNSTEPMAMASTTKIMTAIIALENGNLSDIVKASSKAAAAPPVKMHLQKDEEITLENLLYALMLQSSNDAAVAIAEHIGGDTELFCKKMTEKAAELGCKDTVFRTPNGLDSLDHHSTAEDMAIITRYALDNPEFVKIINTKQISFKTNKKSYDIINKNRFLNEYEGAFGVKTGFTGKAGQCFVGAAKRDDMQLISVVLASGWGSAGKARKWSDTKAIMDYGFKNYKYEQIAQKDTIVGWASVLKSRTKKIDLCLSSSLELPLNENEKSSLEISFDIPKEVSAPIKKGDILGKAVIKISENESYEIPVYAKSQAELSSFKAYILKILKEWFKIGSGSLSLSKATPSFALQKRL